MTPTPLLDTYWRFAHERHSMWQRRLEAPAGPWTDDPILRQHRFTNTYRVLDRVSQYLVAEVQYGHGRSQEPAELFWRTLLFKIFNKIETWQLLERKLGRMSWQSAQPDCIVSVLDEAMAAGTRLYSAAYIMPSPSMGYARKHANHIAMLVAMMDAGLPGRLASTKSLKEAYDLILAWPSMGPFLAFQYTIDLNYSALMAHDESEFVVAGPGALDGISKCFADYVNLDPAEVIMHLYRDQATQFDRMDLPAVSLFGRPLMPIDLQNCLCEISKYTRKSHPYITGVSGRTQIKQLFTPSNRTLPSVFLPPKWGLSIDDRFRREESDVQQLLL